jgi:type IV pilus assembly protein PilO
MKLPDINFSELDVREIGSWDLILRVAVVAAACIVTFIISYIFIIEDQIKVLELQSKQEEDKRKEFKDKYNLAANLDAYQKQMVQVKDMYKKLLGQLPATDQVPELIENISREAENNGLKYDSIKPGEAKSLGFYKELPLDLTLRGTYNGFGGFVSDLSKISRIVTLHDFSIKKAGSGKDNPDPNALTMNLQVKTYWISTDTDDKAKSQPAASKNGANPQSTAIPSAPGAPPTDKGGNSGAGRKGAKGAPANGEM